MLAKIIVSSLLILGVLAIRFMFQKKVNPIYIYILWLPVAVRLLMPGMPVDSPLSIMHTKVWERGSALLAEENERQKTEYREKQYQKYLDKIQAEYADTSGIAEPEEDGSLKENGNIIMAQPDSTDDPEKESEPETVYYELKWQLSGIFFERIRQIAVIIWLVGMIVFSLVFFRRNFSLYRYLRATKRKLRGPFAPQLSNAASWMPRRLAMGCLTSDYECAFKIAHLERRVFTVGDKLASPCLFGLSPAIYIPKKAIAGEEKEESLSIILAHELTHYRHLDHIWALVRILCLIINWYNPLVWIGAKLSLRDGELACDAGCIRRLGEEKRYTYGNALLSMVKPTKERKAFYSHAVLMISEKKFMKKRMENIVENRKGSRAAMMVMLLMLLFCVGFTCTGKAQKEDRRISETTQTVEATAKMRSWAELLYGNPF